METNIIVIVPYVLSTLPLPQTLSKQKLPAWEILRLYMSLAKFAGIDQVQPSASDALKTVSGLIVVALARLSVIVSVYSYDDCNIGRRNQA